MPNGLSSNFTAIHSDIEPKYRSILEPYLTVQYVDQLVNGPPLGIEQIEKCLCMPSWYNERMQRRDRVLVVNGKCQWIKCHNSVLWNVAKKTPGLSGINALPDSPKIFVITGSLICVEFEAKRLEVR